LGRYNYYIADCWLPIVVWKNKNKQQTTIEMNLEDLITTLLVEKKLTNYPSWKNVHYPHLLF
jgi:hypothetical protein